MGRNSPEISVVMPVYNGAKFLREAIDSILSQTFADFEFIIIDDGSTDETISIVNSYTDSRIRLFLNERNMGIIDSLNKGLIQATGNFIARMDADDISMHNRFEKQYQYLNEHPEIALIGCQAEKINIQGETVGIFSSPTDLLDYYYTILIGGGIAVHPTIMIRCDVLTQIGGFVKEWLHVEDYDFWQRLYSNGYKCVNLSDILLKYRVHENQVSTSKNELQLNKRYEKFRQFFFNETGNDISQEESRRYQELTIWQTRSKRDANEKDLEIFNALLNFNKDLSIMQRLWMKHRFLKFIQHPIGAFLVWCTIKYYKLRY
ncbi:MAG: glycosyltransferase [Bacteroidota bacterium]